MILQKQMFISLLHNYYMVKCNQAIPAIVNLRKPENTYRSWGYYRISLWVFSNGVGLCIAEYMIHTVFNEIFN